LAIGGGETLEAETLVVGTPARRHAPPPRAGCRRLRTIDEADHGANPSAGRGGMHTANL